MQLTLNGWPPLASHLACLILGIGAANLSVEAPAASVRVPSRSVAITIPRAKGQPKSILPPGTRAHAVKAEEGDGHQAACRLSAEPFLVIETSPALTLAAPLGEAAALPTLARGLQAGTLRLQPAASGSARELPRCGAAPKVTYGSP